MIAIQVLGVNGHKSTKSLTFNILSALKELNLIAKVEEVSDIDKLIQFDIAGIPAMVINGKLAFQQIVPEIEDLKILLKVLTKPIKKKWVMKNILMPTDFSETAKDAFVFTQSFLAKGATINMLHVIQPQLDPAFPYLGAPSEDYYRQKETSLNSFINDHLPSERDSVALKSAINQQVKTGLPTDVIVEASKNAIDLVIMGGTGATNYLEKVFGSVTTHVVRHAYCPVLVVPEGYKFKGLKKVMYASSVTESDEEMLQNLVDLTWDYDPEIHLVHINKNEEKDYEIEQQQFEQLFREKNPKLGFNIAKIESNNVIKGLHRYAKESDIDLIVMSTRHRNFIDELFHKSMTKKMILNTSIPLLVMHTDD